VAFVAVPGAKRDALDRACARLNGMHWKGCSLSCTTSAFQASGRVPGVGV